MDAIPFLFFCSIALIAAMAGCTQWKRLRSGLASITIAGRDAGKALQRFSRQARARIDQRQAGFQTHRETITRERADDRAARERAQAEGARREQASEPPQQPRDILMVYKSTVPRPVVARLAPARVSPAVSKQEHASVDPPLRAHSTPSAAELAANDTGLPTREQLQKPTPQPPPFQIVAVPSFEEPQPAQQPPLHMPASPALRPFAPVGPPVPPASSERFPSVRQPERSTSQPPFEKQKNAKAMDSEPGRDVSTRLEDVSRFSEDDAEPSMEEIPADDRTPSSLIVFMHVTGGAGATTLAVNTACSLAAPRRNCCLIDLDVQFGGVASLMDLQPQPALQALMQDPRRLERVTLESMLVRHNTGVHVLTAPRVPIPLHGLKASAIGDLMKMAAGRFTYVVVDLPLALTTWTDAVLRPARFIYLVTPLTVQAAHRVARVLHLMKQQDLALLPIKIVANRYNSAGDNAIGPKQFAKAIGRDVDHLLPNDYHLVLQSHNQGVPAVKLAPKAKLSLAIAKMLADDLKEAPAGGQPQQRRFAGFDRL